MECKYKTVFPENYNGKGFLDFTNFGFRCTSCSQLHWIMMVVIYVLLNLIKEQQPLRFNATILSLVMFLSSYFIYLFRFPKLCFVLLFYLLSSFFCLIFFLPVICKLEILLYNFYCYIWIKLKKKHFRLLWISKL